MTVAAQDVKILGEKWSTDRQAETIQLCGSRKLDAAVVTVQSGSNGCNLQGMTWMVALGPIACAADEEQVKGILDYLLNNVLGRCCRKGQMRPTRFYVLWVKGEVQDEAPRMMRESRMSEAEASHISSLSAWTNQRSGRRWLT